MMRSSIKDASVVASAILLAIFPTWLVRHIVNFLGNEISPDVRIGFSVIVVRRLHLAAGTRIGHFNIVSAIRVVMRPNARIGHMNVCYGPFSIWLKEKAQIGNRNSITRAKPGITYGPALLRLGELSKITAQHKVDCTLSVLFGDYVTLAGAGSQIWTHGYIHGDKGPDRYRLDGSVVVGSNVSIGARVTIMGAVRICSHVAIGAGAAIARNLTEPGLYVAAPLRMLPSPQNPMQRDDLFKVEDRNLVEDVFKKSNDSS